MGMRSGKVLKGSKTGRTAKTATRSVAKKPARTARRAKPAAKKPAAPAVKTVTKTVTKTVEVDRNERLRELAQRIIDITIANDEPGMLALYAHDVESKEATNPASVGLDAIKEKFKMWQSMVSDATFTPVSVLADGNTIAIEWSGRVTLAASGRLVEMDEVAVHEIRDGKIVKERFYYDPAVLQG
jgi:ketosteroid isomerase-like protein